MQIIELKTKEIDRKNLVKKSPLDSDTSQIVKEPTVFTLDGNVVMIYGKYEGNLEKIRNACKTIRYDSSDRTGGLKSISRIFGFKPRKIIRGDFCSSTSLSNESPIEHNLIANLGKEFTKLYSKYAPDTFQHHNQCVQDHVRREWVIPGTVFTSGIINKNNSLKYHHDSGNFKKCMSCMLVLKKDVDGGMLSIPEFDLRIDLQDSTYLIFDGQSILHGVTQIKPLHEFSYRYSIVYYALQQMSNCLPPDEELKRIRVVKKAREERRLIKDRTDL